MKKLISALCLLGLIAVSPILGDHARDIYLEEIVTKKAMPVKLNNRIVASSFQLEWQGKRVTVTNNHVCSIRKRVRTKKIQSQIALLSAKGILDTSAGKDTKKIELEVKRLRKLLAKTVSEGVIGEVLKIGDINRKILYNSPNHDICFLEPVGGGSFKLARSVHRGERVNIIGHPRGADQSISDGRIVGKGSNAFPWLPKAGKITVLRTTAISYPGNSGSPVVNRYGNVVGILFAGTSLNYINVNLVVPLEYIESELMAYFGN